MNADQELFDHLHRIIRKHGGKVTSVPGAFPLRFEFPADMLPAELLAHRVENLGENQRLEPAASARTIKSGRATTYNVHPGFVSTGFYRLPPTGPRQRG